MKIAIFSDIHADIRRLKEALYLVKKDSIDKIYHAGDIVGYGENPNEVIDLLRREKIEGVLGNFDEAVAFDLPNCGCHTNTPEEKEKVQVALRKAKDVTIEENKAWLRSLPEELRFETNGKRILIVHATVFAIAQYLYEDSTDDVFKDIVAASSADIIICGHTHIPYYKMIGNIHIVNPGSISYPRQEKKECTYAEIETTDQVRVEVNLLGQ